jgi:hypothetical protein
MAVGSAAGGLGDRLTGGTGPTPSSATCAPVQLAGKAYGHSHPYTDGLNRYAPVGHD